MMPPFVVFPTKRIAYFVEVSLYFILSSTTSYIMLAVLQNAEQLHKNHLYSISILTHLCKIKKALKRAFLFYTNNGVE